MGKRTLPPTPHHPQCVDILDYGAQAQRDIPPLKILVMALLLVTVWDH